MSEDFRTIAGRSAERVAAAFAAQPYRPGQPYDPRPLLAVLTTEQAILQEAVDRLDAPLTVTPDGRPDDFGAELASLMGYLQLLRMRFHGLEDLPDHMRVAAGRYLSTTHLTARRVITASRRPSPPPSRRS